MASIWEILALTRSYDKTDAEDYVIWRQNGTTRFAIANDGELQLPNATASGQGILLGADAEIYRSAASTLTMPALTLGGAIGGGDQTWSNVGDMTFAAGSIMASGAVNGNTLLLRANDTTFITLTTGATDVCTLNAITMSGTWLASGIVTLPAVTLGGAVAGGGQVITNLGALSGTGLVTTTLSAVPQRLIERATSGGPWHYVMVGQKSQFTDNTLTSFLRVTVPNDYIGALLRIDYLANDTGAASRWRSGSRFITIGRTTGADTVKADFEATAEQTILTGGADTIAVTWTLSANTGAVDAQQTFDVQITIDSGDNSTGNLHYIATLLSSYYVGTGTIQATMAEV